MLNGLDPVLIFQFSSLLDGASETLSDIPLISKIPTVIEEPPIPVYLSANITGLYIDSEDKNIDVETSTETLSNGKEPQVSQTGLNSSVTINLLANKNSIGVSLLSALMDQVFDKLSSQEYSVSYLHNATTIFRGKIQSYQVNQSRESDLLYIQIIISRGAKKPSKQSATPETKRFRDSIPLDAQGANS